MGNKTKIIYLTGRPGVGKYTIANALSKSGFIICDNHLINTPIFELLNYDGFSHIPRFAWNSVARIRSAVFDFIATEKGNNYVLTNNLYEDQGDKQIYQEVKEMSEKRNSIFIPIRLLISQKEHLRRITQLDRRIKQKTIDPNFVYDQTPLLKIEDPNFLELDVSKLSAILAAEQILEHVKNIVSK